MHRTILAALVVLVLLGNLGFGLLVVGQRRARLTLAPGASVSDLYPRWLGTRELLLRGANPYTNAATLANERGYYGRVRRPDEASLDPSGYQGFSYPLYVALLLAPVALLPFPILRLAALVALAAGLAWSVWAWARLVGWPADPRWRGALAVAALATLPVLDLLSLQQLSGILVPLFVLVALSLRRGHLATAGALLAVAMIKPQLAALPVAGLIVWTLRDWPARCRLLAGFLVAMTPLIIASLALLPGWPCWFLAQGRVYVARNALLSPVTTLLPWLPGESVLGAAIVLLSLATWARARSGPELVDALALSITATILLVPSAATYNDTFLFLPALLVARDAASDRRGPRRLLARITVALVAVIALAGAAALLLWALRLPVWLNADEQVIFAGYVVLALPVWLALVWQQRRPEARSIPPS